MLQIIGEFEGKNGPVAIKFGEKKCDCFPTRQRQATQMKAPL